MRHGSACGGKRLSHENDGRASLALVGQRLPDSRPRAPVAGSNDLSSNVEPRKVATDCRTIAYLTPKKVEGASPTTCIVAPIEGGAPIATFAWPPRVLNVKWTPDGKERSFLGETDRITNLFIQPLSGGSPRPVTRLTEGGNDGRAPEPITEFATGSIFAIDNSKDGKTLLPLRQRGHRHRALEELPLAAHRSL